MNYRDGMTMSWTLGRSLSQVTKANKTYSFKYNADGLRTEKKCLTDGDTEHYYYDSNGNMIAFCRNNAAVVYFYYDSEGNVTSMSFEGTKYFFIKNIQGDVEKIVTHQGIVAVTYKYDPWGKLISKTDNTVYGIGELNPFRYRGYIYDDETGLYYLKSRYYDPVTGRFLNADIYTDTNTGTPLSTNMFAYCENNVANSIDRMGDKAIDITKSFSLVMYKNALYLYNLARFSRWLGTTGKIALLTVFYKFVKTNGPWDFKNQKEWKLKSRDYYKFLGKKVSVADLGNIHFGFVGSVIFKWRTLCIGAGIYQIYSGTSSWKYWHTFFDDPRDTFCITLGRIMWKRMFNKRVFNW